MGILVFMNPQTPKNLNIQKQEKQTRIYQSVILCRNMNEGGPFVNNEDDQNSDWASETHKWILEG